MTNSNSEQERIRRLRERQLADRDPHTRQRQLQQFHARRERKLSKQKTTLGQMWKEIPHAYKGPFYGLLAGLLALFVVPMVWDSSWALPCVGGGTLFLVILGLVTGRAMDARDNIKDLLR